MALIQHWKCQDNAASTVVVADVGTNGTLVGGDNTSDKATTGPGTALTSAFDMNGSDDLVDISAASISFVSGEFTFAAWINLDATTVQGVFGISGSNNSTLRIASSTSFLFRTGVNSTFAVPEMSTGTWYHLLLSRSAAGNVRLFLDGVESSTGALANDTTFAPTRFANQNAAFLNGRICDVRVYDSDESANVATIMAEKDAGGATFQAAWARGSNVLLTPGVL